MEDVNKGKGGQQQGQGPKEGQTNQGKHLGQQKQQAGEIGRNATHGKSAEDHGADATDEGDEEPTQTGGEGGI